MKEEPVESESLSGVKMGSTSA